MAAFLLRKTRQSFHPRFEEVALQGATLSTPPVVALVANHTVVIGAALLFP